MNRSAFSCWRRLTVDRVTYYVKHTALGVGTNWDANRCARCDDVVTTLQTVGAAHGNGTNCALVKVLCNFEGNRFFVMLNCQCIVHAWQILIIKFNIYHDTNNLDNVADARLFFTHHCLLITH